jgi:hypothetical protein
VQISALGIAAMPAEAGVAIDPLDCGRMYTATGGDGLVYRSANSGATWEVVLAEYADDIVINSQSPHRAYVAAEGTVYRSVDCGHTWSSYGPEAGLTGYIECITVNPVNQDVVYAGGPGGVFRSTDGGVTWSDYGESLPSSTFVYSIAVDGETGETVLIGTYTYGVFRRTDQLAGIESLPEMRGTSELALQAYPNPFMDETSVSYRSSGSACANLAVYDVTGRLINTLVAEGKVDGLHSATWNGRDTAGNAAGPGVYFLTLYAGNEREVKPIVLFR